MTRRAELHPEARVELLEAVRYYAERSGTAAKRFHSQVRLAIRNVLLAPNRYPLIIDDYRRAVLAKFPYIVVYRVREPRVYVVAIAHAKREPYYWRSR